MKHFATVFLLNNCKKYRCDRIVQRCSLVFVVGNSNTNSLCEKVSRRVHVGRRVRGGRRIYGHGRVYKAPDRFKKPGLALNTVQRSENKCSAFGVQTSVQI